MKTDLSKYYDFIIINCIATDEEIQLCTSVAGWDLKTFNGIIYARTAYHDPEQCLQCEPGNFTDIDGYFNGDE